MKRVEGLARFQEPRVVGTPGIDFTGQVREIGGDEVRGGLIPGLTGVDLLERRQRGLCFQRNFGERDRRRLRISAGDARRCRRLLPAAVPGRKPKRTKEEEKFE